MKVLKSITIICVALVLVTALLMMYLFMSAEVTVEVVGSQMVSAAEVSNFSTLKNTIDEETFIGTVYNKPSQWHAAEEYAYVTYNLAVKNGCLVPIELVEVQVVPLPEDVVQLGNVQEFSLNPKTEGTLNASILTHAGGTPAREMIVSYYVWGISFQQRIVAGR